MKKEVLTLQEDSVIAETEKKTIAKQRRKAKSLLTDEGGHSEIALEVHALRETLIQLSLNLSNVEEVKYSSIASEVQALRETVTELNSDLSNRVSEIEKRTEQVHTLLCRFIMTRCGNYKEPPTQATTTVKEHHLDTSDVAVQTEIPETKQVPVTRLSESQNALKLDHSKSVDHGDLPNETDKPKSATDELLIVSKEDNEKKNQAEPKALFPTPSLPIKEHTTPLPPEEQAESHGFKHSRLDNNRNKISEESSHNGTSNEAPSSRKHSKEKPPNDQNKSRHSKTEHHHQHLTSQQSYNSNQELAELAYRYSSEDNKSRKRKQQNHSQKAGSNRKRPRSKKMQKSQDFHSSDKSLDRASGGYLDDFDMDKVIDEWAEDED